MKLWRLSRYRDITGKPACVIDDYLHGLNRPSRLKHGRAIRRGLDNLNLRSGRVRARKPHPNHPFILINSQNLSIPNLHN
jgi:hypothetical protein